MADAEDYLQEGFDPRSVTMPRLRSILVTHNVEYPATAKKGQLVDLVTEHVLSQADKLRDRRARAKRSSMGIVNAGSAEDTGTWDDHDLAPPPQSVRRSKSPRKSSARIKVEDDEMVTPARRSPSKRASRSVSRALSHTDDHDVLDYEAPRTNRRSRSRRTVTPQIKIEPEAEEDEEDLQVSADEQSAFTYDNPFQSRSSPAQAKTPTNRRRTADGDVLKSAKSTSRRRTDGYTEAFAGDFETPRLRPRTPELLLEPGEEFTPDAQLELEEAASRGEVSVEPRKPAEPAKRKSSFKTPFFVLFLGLFGAYLAWYRQEKIAVGYCEIGRPAKELLSGEFPLPDALRPFIEPDCEPCPSHAYCYEDFDVSCEANFVLEPHPLSLGGLVPLPPTCEPDGEKARRVQAVADKAIEELRDRRAKFECGELVNEDGQQEISPGIPEEELKATVSRKRSKRLNSDEFDELWAAAIGEVTARDEVEVQVVETQTPSDSSSIPNRRLSSTSLARLSLTCTLKRHLRLSLARYRLTIGLLIASVLAIFYMRARYRKHVATSAQVPALVDLVLERLANQKELGEEEIDDPYLFLPNLRDDVLRSVHSLSEREGVWQRVRAVVEQNSNVRTSQREGRSGEVGRAWEWIGPIAGEGARRRRSGRLSLGPDVKAETPELTPEPKKWEEKRPIY
ncbi:Man1-Src1p-C-terminal domain-containing protein [Dactylonectria estremocensis]|uniref:Man1-Src1p-C-terminal domain-containing protein n=1 Tax=Dactylonectria estremocensis TaxID=1079267 RepID=A0A9P9FHN3_9HYPO|nr:Man1-Src1p-C-terminal domain-containing protein [Dactylonectria estremocensis]